MFENSVLQGIKRVPVRVPTLGCDDVIAVRALEQARDAEPGTRPDDADDSRFRQVLPRSADVAVRGWAETGDCMSDRLEVVDDHEALDTELFLHQRRADDPRIVGELEHVAAHGPSEGDRQLVGKRVLDSAPEFLPGMLEAGEFLGLDRNRFA